MTLKINIFFELRCFVTDIYINIEKQHFVQLSQEHFKDFLLWDKKNLSTETKAHLQTPQKLCF